MIERKRVTFNRREVVLIEKALIHLLSSPDYQNQDVIRTREGTIQLIRKVQQWR